MVCIPRKEATSNERLGDLLDNRTIIDKLIKASTPAEQKNALDTTAAQADE